MPPSRLAAAAVLAGLASLAGAEQLPLRIYTAADGLPSDRVSVLLADSHGFLWLGTEDGLSRFDGDDFRNFAAADGVMPGPVHALLEARDGVYWIGTGAGLLRLDAARSSGPGAVRALHLPGGALGDDVLALMEDGEGGIWVGTEDGLFRLDPRPADARFERVAFAPRAASNVPVNALLPGAGGVVWIGSEIGLYRGTRASGFERVPDDRAATHDVQCLLRDRQGAVWVGSRLDGLHALAPNGGAAASWRAYSVDDGLPGQHVTALAETADGTLWASCYGGLAEIGPDRRSVRRYTAAEGLSSVGLSALAEDRDGDLWIASDSVGVMRFARNGFRRFDTGDGLTTLRVASLFESRDGAPCAFTRGQRPEDIVHGDGFLACFDGRRFRTRRFRVPPGTLYGWGWAQFALQDEQAEWWVPTLSGLFRFPGVPFEALESTPPRRLYAVGREIPGSGLLRLFEDRHGDLWMTLTGADGALARWDRRSDSIRVFRPADGFPSRQPMAFAEDGDGAVWIGLRGGGLARYRDGSFSLAEAADGLPSGSIRALAVDARGRLWVGSARGGVARLDRPQEWPPRFVSYGPAQGLSSGNTSSLALDAWGRVYVGTERGLDRLDPATGNVQRFTADDGLPHGVIETSLADRRGDLWFGSVEGLSRLTPQVESPRLPPATRIARLFVNGVLQPVPDVGATTLTLTPSGPGPVSLQIDYVALDFAPGGRPRYQYRLDGVDGDWAPPTDQRSIVYARLPAGAYRFRVRAVANDGSVGATPAEVGFRVLPPFWRQPEAIALLAAALAAAAYAFHRIRLSRALAVERVRTRVASDLHDDIGSGLSEIAILSELVRTPGSRDRAPVLAEIGDRARGLVDSMSDIVWSTDPRRDDVGSLVQRIRRFAANTLEGRGIAWTLEAPDGSETLPLDPDRRRQILLIVKEALTNVARHSGATRAAVRLAPTADGFAIEIEDDGRGFAVPAAGASDGLGVSSMRERARSLGAAFRVEPRPSGGTRIAVHVPRTRAAAARPA
ncbi:MAG TPA: two-component regulator propeller domain-containing protein [Thermoanaerobaculia bacterium]|nr:two-component regulator propeller domain-containing protein [Thermoanaerobaculia bacterium]